uniref:Putative E3 ubiquitin-protein ligase RING1a n=1 Tax=Rhizophora mucronata TaxID=61149 RepID=A0A2P2QHL4_RHIMU
MMNHCLHLHLHSPHHQTLEIQQSDDFSSLLCGHLDNDPAFFLQMHLL